MYINQGIYSISDISKILGINYATSRNWVKKYLINRTFKNDDDIILSFWDLIEIKFIKNFIDSGVSNQKVFKAYVKAKEEISSENPFAYNFTTDKKEIFAKNTDKILNILSEQMEMPQIVNSFLHSEKEFNFKKYITFDEKHRPLFWHPYGDGDKDIIIDPTRALGQPVLKNRNITTDMLYDSLIAEKHNFKEVANFFNISSQILHKAYDYEQSLRASL